MRFRSLLLSGVAAAALYFAAPQAVTAREPGFYAEAGVGLVWLEDRDVTVSDDFGEVSRTQRGSIAFDTGWAAGVRTGYDFQGPLRLELEATWRQNDGSFSADGDLDGTVNSVALMANAYADFPMGWITPYIGVGAGVLFVNQDGGIYDILGIDGTQAVFAAQGRIGASVDFDDNWSLTTDYTYIRGFGLDTPDGNGSHADADLGAHTWMVGIRYTFHEGGTVVPAVVQGRNYLVFFDFDSSQLTPDAQAIVASAAADALSGGSPRLDVTGHTDRSGSDAYNQALSIRRATAVQNALIANGVSAALIVIRGAGESEPLVPTADGVREPQNRRVEIVIN
jgi:OOP family OmpA-OmpF porin